MKQSDRIILDDLTHVASANFIYKYTSPENGIRLLKSSKLHFSSPLMFNDPYDCHPLLVKITDDYIYNVLNQSKYKYLLKTKGFTKSKTYLDYVKNFSKTQVKEVQTKILPNVKITCFSEEKNNKLLWSHYAKNHTGVCLEISASLTNEFRSGLTSPTKHL